MGNVNSQFLLSLLIIGLGYASKRFKLIKETDGEAVSRIIFNFTLPGLVINTFSTIKVDFSLGLIPVINIAYGIIITALALFFFRKNAKKKRGLLSIVSPGFNIGLFAYPLVEAIWGQDGLKYFGMFDMGNAIIMFGFIYILATYFASDETRIDFLGILKRMFHSIPLLVYIGTLAVNLSGLHFPAVVLDVSKILAKGNMPLSLLLLGIYLNFSFESSYWKDMLKVLSLRYITGIVIGVILFFTMPFEPMFKNTILIGLILPIGMAVFPYAVQYEYDVKFIGTLANMTIVISFVLVWIITNILTRL